MALKEKTLQSDLYLYEIMRNPVLSTEFVNNFDTGRREEPFELSWYQKEWLLDFSSYVVIRSARAVGKTVTIVSLMIWLLIYNTFPEEYVVMHFPNKVHLDPVWNGLIRAFRSNSFLKQLIPPQAGINSSDFRITLNSQATLICRIAGMTGGGISVIGLHTPFCVFDESGFYPYNTFIEAQPTLNTFTSGFRMVVTGTPSGLREHNILYSCDQENSSYSKHYVSAFRNSRFTEADNLRAKEQYGGEDSDDYQHLVLGMHGKPVFSLFDRSTMEISNYPVYQLKLSGMDMMEDIGSYYSKMSLFPGLPDRSSQCLIGIDLGYTEPTAIIIQYLDTYGRIKFHGRIQLTKVSYPIQEKLINLLDDKFRPFLIGMDVGGVGKPVYQHLIGNTDYIHKDFEKRIIPVDFSTSTIMGIDTNGEEIKIKTKPLAVSVLQDYASNHKMVFTTTDLELVTELERMTYAKSVSGDISYRTLTVLGGKKGEDHFTSALLCSTLAYYKNNDFILNQQKRKKLMGSSWLVG